MDRNPIPGRVCAGTSGCPYLDAFGSIGASCRTSGACELQALAGQDGSFSSCRVGRQEWSNVITTWKP